MYLLVKWMFAYCLKGIAWACIILISSTHKLTPENVNVSTGNCISVNANMQICGQLWWRTDGWYHFPYNEGKYTPVIKFFICQLDYYYRYVVHDFLLSITTNDVCLINCWEAWKDDSETTFLKKVNVNMHTVTRILSSSCLSSYLTREKSVEFKVFLSST